MPDTGLPTRDTTESSADARKVPPRRTGFWIRVAIFAVIVVGCGWYTGELQSAFSRISPHRCADGNMALFVVDFEAFPARIGEQFNLCSEVSTGHCERTTGDQVIQGECRNHRMDGPWSLKHAKTGALSWSGTYCNGFPCGEFRRRMVDAEHEFVFRVENMHIHGPAILWERENNRWIELSGRYDQGKRTGRWVRHAEPGHVLHSVTIYDESGFVSTTSFSCTNGNRKEVRGQKVFLYDSKGNAVEPNEANGDSSFCPMP